MSSTQFANYVTSNVFALSLSRPMIEMLVTCAVTGTRTGFGRSNFVTTSNALADRGLLEDCEVPVNGVSQKMTVVRHGKLSRPGELVVELLKESGQYQQVADQLFGEVSA